MATVTRENIGTLHDKITVKLTKEDYWPSFEKSLKQFAKQANVPGFRKGMVPAGMIRKMYGQSIFGDEVIRSAGSQLEDYLKEQKLSIFAQPMIIPNEERTQLDMNNPGEVDFSFEIGVKPEFEIPPVKNKATVTRYQIDITEKMVEDEVNRISRRYGKVEDREEVATDDDIIYATYELSDENGTVAEESQKVEDTVLFSKMPEKLREQLKGKKPGETLVFRPADIAEGDELNAFMKDPLKSTADAAGNHYKLTLTKVGFLIPAELNSELFLQTFPNDMIADEAAFREKVREELSTEYGRVTRDRLHNEIYELLVHNTPIQLPETFLKRWLKEGQEKPKSDEEVEREYPGMDHQLRWTLISDQLMIENQIQVSRQEVIDDIKARVLSYFGMEADEEATWMDSYMQKVMKDEKTMDETYRRLLFDRLFEWLEGQLTIEEKTIGEEEFFKLQSPHEAHHHHH